jgi:hypothetical protein
VFVACNDHNRTSAAYYVEHAFDDMPKPWPVIRLDCVWLRREPPRSQPHYFVSTLRYGMADELFPDWPTVHEVSREGAVFAVIRRNPLGTPRDGRRPWPI